MNVENMQTLAKVLKTLPENDDTIFDIDTWGDYDIYGYIDLAEIQEDPLICNTPGCLAGWAFLMCADDKQKEQYLAGANSIERLAQDILGLTDLQAKALFLGYLAFGHANYQNVTPKNAAAVVEYMIEHPNDKTVWSTLYPEWAQESHETRHTLPETLQELERPNEC